MILPQSGDAGTFLLDKSDFYLQLQNRLRDENRRLIDRLKEELSTGEVDLKASDNRKENNKKKKKKSKRTKKFEDATTNTESSDDGYRYVCYRSFKHFTLVEAI